MSIAPASQFVNAIARRRSIYALGNKLPVSKQDVVTTVKTVVRQCPSAFNSQSSRAVILFGADHQKVWDIVRENVKKLGLPAPVLNETVERINTCFAPGAGTVLFYEDQNTVKQMQKDFPLYADRFPLFSEHSSAIAQYAVWCALAQVDIGATRQHYVDNTQPAIRSAFELPESWKLIAQMPFGSIEKPAEDKTFIPDEQRFKVFGL